MTAPLLRARDVATLLDVSVETVLRWHRSGKLPGGYRLASNCLRFDAGEIDVWLAAQKRTSATPTEGEPAGLGSWRPSRFSPLAAEDGVDG